jgi:hypothetical protein
VSRSGVVLSPHAANMARDGAFRRDHGGLFGDNLFMLVGHWQTSLGLGACRAVLFA